MTEAKMGDVVRINYTGRLTNGTQFDSSSGKEPLEFTIGLGQVIKGLEAQAEGPPLCTPAPRQGGLGHEKVRAKVGLCCAIGYPNTGERGERRCRTLQTLAGRVGSEPGFVASLRPPGCGHITPWRRSSAPC